MSSPEQPKPPVEPIYVDPITGAPLQVDPVTGQLTYGSATTTPLSSNNPLPSTNPLPPTVPLPAGELPSAFPTTGPAPADATPPTYAMPPGYPPAYPQQPGYPAQPGYVAPYGYPGQPGYAYGAPGYSYPLSGAPAVGRNGLALASMIVSLCSICVGGIVAGLVGAILGHVARRQIRQSGQDGAGMALTGIIVGWAVVALYGGFIAFVVASSVSSN